MLMTLMKCIFSFKYADYTFTSSHMDIINHLFIYYIKVIAINAVGIFVILYMLYMSLKDIQYVSQYHSTSTSFTQ